MTKTKPAVRFKRRWRQYGPGDIATTLDEGVMGTMVSRHIAEYCAAPKATASPRNKALKREQSQGK